MIFEQLAFVQKNKVALKFFIVLDIYFLSFRIFEQPALTLKTEFALKFFKPVGRQHSPPPAPPPRRPMGPCALGATTWTQRAFG